LFSFFVYCSSFFLVGNKLDLVQDGRATREVTTEEAIEFAKSENMDFLETSALTCNHVEKMFRRLILAVAKIIPEVKNNLEIAALPDGWMIKMPDTDKLEGNNPASASAPSSSSRMRAASNDASTTMETSATVASYGTSKMTPSSLDSRFGRTAERRKSTLLRLSYMNYWTGECQPELPVVAASPDFIFLAPPKPLPSSQTEKQKVQACESSTKEDVDRIVDDLEIENQPINNERKNTASVASNASGGSQRNKKLIREESVGSGRDSERALTERSSSVKTIELSDKYPKKTHRCSNCTIQ
jgi:hypothetical protein